MTIKNSRTKKSKAGVEAVSAKAANTRFSAPGLGQVVGVVRFGGVIVESIRPSPAEAKKNIDAGRTALKRAKTALTRPGVQVRMDPKIPLYHADPENPEILVRDLNGRITRGRMVAGRFKSI